MHIQRAAGLTFIPEEIHRRRITAAATFAIGIKIADMRIGRISEHALAHQEPGILISSIMENLLLIDVNVVMLFQLAHTLMECLIHQLLHMIWQSFKIRLMVVDSIAQQMTFLAAAKQCRKLDGRDDLDPGSASCLHHLIDAAHAVMVRQCDQIKTALSGNLDQLNRCKFPVLAVTRMHVKIKIVHIHHPAHYNRFFILTQQKGCLTFASFSSLIQPIRGHSVRRARLLRLNQ